MRIKNVLDYKAMTVLFGFSRQSWNNWKKEKRPIITLLEKYFTDLDINEFLEHGKISKYELIKDIDSKELEYLIKNQNSSNERLHELIKFFSIYDAKELASILAEGLRNNGLEAQYLDKIPNMQQCIYTLRNILNDRSSEIENDPTVPIFEFVLRDFNEKVGFDFSENDELIVTHILGRFRVYDTLYNLESTPKVLSS